MKPHFLTSLDVTPLDDGIHWRLNKMLKFVDKKGELHVVHRGFLTDFASVPPLAFIAGLVLAIASPVAIGAAWLHCVSVLGWASAVIAFAVWVCVVADKFNCDDTGASKLDAPAVIHDNGYGRPHLGGLWTKIRMKQYWDGVLYQAMLANGVDKFTANTVWFMLLLFGWFAYFRKAK